MKKLLKKLGPDRFEDIIAVLALYRPGPLGSGMVDDFILRNVDAGQTVAASLQAPVLFTIAQDLHDMQVVITSYSIHYTKLYDFALDGVLEHVAITQTGERVMVGEVVDLGLGPAQGAVVGQGEA